MLINTISKYVLSLVIIDEQILNLRNKNEKFSHLFDNRKNTPKIRKKTENKTRFYTNVRIEIRERTKMNTFANLYYITTIFE